MIVGPNGNGNGKERGRTRAHALLLLHLCCVKCVNGGGGYGGVVQETVITEPRRAVFSASSAITTDDNTTPLDYRAWLFKQSETASTTVARDSDTRDDRLQICAARSEQQLLSLLLLLCLAGARADVWRPGARSLSPDDELHIYFGVC